MTLGLPCFGLEAAWHTEEERQGSHEHIDRITAIGSINTRAGPHPSTPELSTAA